MKHCLKFSLLIVTLFFAVSPLFAQSDAPDRTQPQATVLQAMSERFGANITVTSLSARQWFFGSYTYVRGLGCPDSPTTPPAAGGWQRFEMTYQNTKYVYLVTDDAQTLITCNEALLPTQVPSATPFATATSAVGSGSSGGGQVATMPATSIVVTPIGGGTTGGGQIVVLTATPMVTIPTRTISTSQPTNIPGCELPIRLSISATGEVTPGEPNWVHTQPARTASKAGEIPGGERFSVLDGPQCDTATGMIFWLVEYNGLVGWTSEGLDDYWVVPIPQPAFTQQNIRSATMPEWLASYPRDGEIIIAFSSFSQFVLTGDNMGNVILRDIRDSAAGIFVRQSNHQSAITVLAFSPDERLFASGSVDGMVIVNTMATDAEAVSNRPLAFQHSGMITALAFSSSNPANALLVVADDTGKLTFWSITDNATPLLVIELTEPAGDLELSQDTRNLIIRDADGYLLTAFTVPR